MVHIIFIHSSGFKILFIFIYFWSCWVFIAYAQAFSGRSDQGLLFVTEHGILIAVTSLVAEHRLQLAWASVVAAHRHVSCSSKAQ